MFSWRCVYRQQALPLLLIRDSQSERNTTTTNHNCVSLQWFVCLLGHFVLSCVIVAILSFFVFVVIPHIVQWHVDEAQSPLDLLGPRGGLQTVALPVAHFMMNYSRRPQFSASWPLADESLSSIQFRTNNLVISLYLLHVQCNDRLLNHVSRVFFPAGSK